jgi:hypothetical protein
MHVVQSQLCKVTLLNDDHQLSDNDDDLNSNAVSVVCNLDGDRSLIEQSSAHQTSGYNKVSKQNNKYLAGVELLDLLRRAKCPVYLFDEIIKWTRRSAIQYQISFENTIDFTREKMIDEIAKRYDLKGMFPMTEDLYLPGLQINTTLVMHDFRNCLYSILTDTCLMKDENMLFGSIDAMQTKPKKLPSELNDIDSGSVFIKAFDKFVKDDNDLFCPVLFFIDKTHTDIHGRFCLEPLQFTLGIFNQTVRGQPRAWRTLGYVNDLQLSYKESVKKLQDYHLMLRVILKSFIKSQKDPIIWEFKSKTTSRFLRLRLPVLFVIGDTEGHDKLCGRYSNRSKTKSLCRYCDIPFDKTDEPFYKFNYITESKVKRLLKSGNKEMLQTLSLHNIKNTWHEVEFCDSQRGIHGATLAEVLHCIQQGMFEYGIKSLFQQKKELKGRRGKRRKKENKEEETEEEESVSSAEMSDNNSLMSEDTDSDDVDLNDNDLQDIQNINKKVKSNRRLAIGDGYRDEFDSICRQYGRYLQRQSDRDLPRTLFNTNYVSVAKKNANEVAGIILVFLLVFSSSEGSQEGRLNQSFGKRADIYIHAFELLLMVENFCKQQMHARKDVLIVEKGMPLVMNTLKNIFNRQQGNGMKIIKFHLMSHFAHDILRFGSMRNYDSSIGERHHATEVKEPARRTQRRKGVFEFQTAIRYVENIGIQRASADIRNNSVELQLDRIENKKTNIIYDYESQEFKKLNWRTKQYEITIWEDHIFQKTLQNICNELIQNKKIDPPVHFFTQHNRNSFIFRADPSYSNKGPWYDWVNVDWELSEPVPAKLLLFIDLSEQFISPFQVGDSYVSEPGCYAIAYSTSMDPQKSGYMISLLLDYKHIDVNKNHQPQLIFFNVNAIHSACIAVPFKTDDTIINAIKWLILKPRSEWNALFIEHLKENIKEIPK